MMMDRGWSGECQERQRKQHRNAEVAEQLAIGHCKLQTRLSRGSIRALDRLDATAVEKFRVLRTRNGPTGGVYD